MRKITWLLFALTLGAGAYVFSSRELYFQISESLIYAMGYGALCKQLQGALEIPLLVSAVLFLALLCNLFFFFSRHFGFFKKTVLLLQALALAGGVYYFSFSQASDLVRASRIIMALEPKYAEKLKNNPVITADWRTEAALIGNPDQASFIGFTPLTQAASACNVEATQFFLQRGANTNLADCPGFLPVLSAYVSYVQAADGARAQQCNTVMQMLLAAGADRAPLDKEMAEYRRAMGRK